MASAVLVLSVSVAMDPVRIGITALLISRPRPMLNLFAIWLGGMAAGIATALVVLIFLRDLALSLMREVGSTSSSSTVAYIHVAIGVLAVLMAARLWARQHAPVPVAGGDSSVPGPGRRRTRHGIDQRGSRQVARVANRRCR